MRTKLVTAMSVSSITFANANDINSVKQEIKSIEESKNADYDVQKAVAALYEKLTQLEAKYKEDSDKDSKITELNQKIEKLEKKQAEDTKQKHALPISPPGEGRKTRRLPCAGVRSHPRLVS